MHQLIYSILYLFSSFHSGASCVLYPNPLQSRIYQQYVKTKLRECQLNGKMSVSSLSAITHLKKLCNRK